MKGLPNAARVDQAVAEKSVGTAAVQPAGEYQRGLGHGGPAW